MSLETTPLRFCSYPRCTTRVPSGRCDQHRRPSLGQKSGKGARKTSAQRGYGGRWQRYRRQWLKRFPLCGTRANGERSAEHSLCAADSATVLGNVVDHVIPVSGPDDPLFWDSADHQTLCERCHNRKTVLEGSGFVKRIPGERFVITGPPGSGKSTWVQHRARPGDIVFDLDALASVVTQVPRFPRPVDAMRGLVAMREGLTSWLLDACVAVNVFIVVTDEADATRIATQINARLRNMADGR